jgi:hypothetical protein
VGLGGHLLDALQGKVSAAVCVLWPLDRFAGMSWAADCWGRASAPFFWRACIDCCRSHATFLRCCCCYCWLLVLLPVCGFARMPVCIDA